MSTLRQVSNCDSVVFEIYLSCSRFILRMQEIRSSNPPVPVVTGICDSSKSRARHHRTNV